jgi:DNA modification methylase
VEIALAQVEIRALALADNKLPELGAWDPDNLIAELAELTDPNLDLGFDFAITGFETVEIDQILGAGLESKKPDPADASIPPADYESIRSNVGSLWICGNYRVLCGNALDPSSYSVLLEGERAHIVFTDPPYNVANAGHVTRRAGVREFAMAHGDLRQSEYTELLHCAATRIAEYAKPGCVVYIAMDWRHLDELSDATRPVFGPMKNLIVWVKTNAGLGSFYRSQHEMISVYVTQGGPVTNNFKLGARGRHRSNVWRYPGFNGFGRDRDATLALHPTVKPVALVTDALLDCSNRGEVVLDPFGGSGTTMIAAERCGRRARLIEIDPVYCDVIVRRWEILTGKTAQLATSPNTVDGARCNQIEEEDASS